MKKVLPYILIGILIAAAIPQNQAYADINITPLSSVNFVRATVIASETGNVSFSATLRKQCSTVSVSSCTLQKQEDGHWVFAASLGTPPSKSNTFKYTADKDYSSDMTPGITYRIVATFEADGESVTKTSSSFTY